MHDVVEDYSRTIFSKLLISIGEPRWLTNKINCEMATLMKRKNSIFVLALLSIWMLPIALNIPLVQADAGGIGKFLTIGIVGEGYVTATKVKSGEYWEFLENGTEKVGAGTILLEPFAAEGYRFVEWIGDVNPDNTYKTKKYGVVEAVFEELTYTITASAGSEGWIDPAGAVSVTHGADITFTFGPNDPDNYKITTIVVDGDTIGVYAESYTFTGVTEDHTIHVAFDEKGKVSVDEGPGGNYFVDSSLVIEIEEVYTGGVIIGYSILESVQPGTAIGFYVIEWETAGAPTFEGGVVLALLIPEGSDIDPYAVRIIHGDSREAIWSDVNNDLQVGGTDVSIVANAIKYKLYDPRLDINNDLELTEADIFIINQNKGTTLEDVTGPVVPGPDGSYFVTTIPLGENRVMCWR
jgi:hypothetical protein